ncbi:Bacterial regulatory protein, tetR family [Methyloligella halotolerans]|uniref:Bacterial regulatory protein, tetR family n=1 Tax=Methyloligella halotolerans TaxID=1177755 RepID=A0A1E2RXV0_9HYPH|nr:TetR family transcriptional regulator [Methyloligella halotolerans]ODA66935.1 Bacterial regulatory protein, tetR family [Methyloligella halotolerans]
MLNDFSNRTKIVRAAMELAESEGWNALSLNQIAERAGVSLADLRREFDSKSDILRVFQREVDGAVLEKMGAPDMTQPAKDRLLDAIMTRFEVMAPFRPGLRRIVKDLGARPGEAGQLLPSALAAQSWMMEAAGIPSTGPVGRMKVAGLTGVYGYVLRYWLEDESPGYEKTMALLDRKLTNGDRALSRVSAACGCVSKMLCRCAPDKKRNEEESAAPPPPPPSSASPDMNGASNGY